MDYYPLKNSTPLPPRNLKAEVGIEYINLTWDNPLANGSSPIVGYKIYRNGTLIAIVPASQLYYNDTSVIDGVKYTYYVTAINSVGESAPSSKVVIASQPATVPEFQSIWALLSIIIALIGAAYRRK